MDHLWEKEINALPPMLGLEDEMVFPAGDMLSAHYTALIGSKRVFVFVEWYMGQPKRWYITIGPSHASNVEHFDYSKGGRSEGWYVGCDSVALLGTLHELAAGRHPKSVRNFRR